MFCSDSAITMATRSISRLSRRQLLQASSRLAAVSLMGALHGCHTSPNAILIGGFQAPGETYGVGAIDLNGNTRWQLRSPSRVHGPAIESRLKIGAVAARRPGDFIQLFSAESGTILETIPSPEGLFFEGHVEFAANRLWATAAREGDCKALLLSWDLNQLSGQPEILQLPGIGPHQVLQDKDRLWLAVGGWQTRDRVITNAANFESFLLEINPYSKEIKHHGNPAPGLSLRHLGASDGEIYVAMQYASPGPTDHPLVYRYTGGIWSALDAPARGWEVFNGYIASVAVNKNRIMATSPQGHHVGLWERATLQSVQVEKILDASAAMSAGEKLKAASGVGVIMDAENLSMRTQTEFHWDNHWVGYVPS